MSAHGIAFLQMRRCADPERICDLTARRVHCPLEEVSTSPPPKVFPICTAARARKENVANVIVIAALVTVVLVCEAWLRKHRRTEA